MPLHLGYQQLISTRGQPETASAAILCLKRICWRDEKGAPDDLDKMHRG